MAYRGPSARGSVIENVVFIPYDWIDEMAALSPRPPAGACPLQRFFRIGAHASMQGGRLFFLGSCVSHGFDPQAKSSNPSRRWLYTILEKTDSCALHTGYSQVTIIALLHGVCQNVEIDDFLERNLAVRLRRLNEGTEVTFVFASEALVFVAIEFIKDHAKAVIR